MEPQKPCVSTLRASIPNARPKKETQKRCGRANQKGQHRKIRGHAAKTAGFTRTHINGHTQTKQEWINQLKHDQLVYHSFEFHDTKIKIDGTTATLVGKVTSDATLYGEHRVWQLHIRQTFLKSGGRWQASRSIVTQW